MTLRVLIDMNLSPDWVGFLAQQGFQAIHWSTVGDPRALDRAIMDWAVSQQHIVFTHDVDFGTILALTHDSGPSVLQVRTTDPFPDKIGTMILAALRQYAPDLEKGAIVVVDAAKSRVRILPI